MTGAWVYCELPDMIASAPKLDSPKERLHQRRIESSLKSLTDTRSLKELFYDRLHYDRVNETISTRRFADSVRASLGDSEPLLLANGGVGGQFKVIYTRLSSQQIYKQEQRGIIEALLGIHPHSLFVFSNQAQDDWHFINAKYDEKNTQRRLLRRIVVNQREQLRTAIEQIGELDLQAIGLQCRKKTIELEPLEIQIEQDKAFDVEKVTERFFSEYKLVFDSVKGSIEGIKNEEQKHLFTQKLFNRLMFIAFVQKKGWLEFNGSQDYFKALWQDYQKAKSQPLGNFYRDRLSHLFFAGLNDPDRQGDKKLIKLIGNVPYLNGGLFEEDTSEMVPGIVVPDRAIEDILTKLFDRFNFTVSESTPLDVDVAVDPEMLGKVFEELVTARHGSGSYYTPKPIVSFMCREALKGYLVSQLTEPGADVDCPPAESLDDLRAVVAQFVDCHDANGLTNPERVLDALRRVKTCDPACGSGAYLLGMLHELLDLRQCLFARTQQDTATVYDRKLEIIQENLYGVDIDPFAMNIARLRLWLSLAVEYTGEKPQPLPNLKFKIEQGDSLLAPNPNNEVVTNAGVLANFRQNLLPRYRAAKAEYMKAHVAQQKQRLEEEINNLKTQFVTYGGSKQVKGFDWAVEFAEVMADGGFDVVVANPPYGATVDESTRDLYFDRKTEGAQSKDTYGLFIARGLQLLKPGGKLSYIVSDTWRTIKSHRPLRKRILAETKIDHIIDLPSWIFKATVNTCIFTAAKELTDDAHHLITADLHNLKDKDWNNLALNLNAVADQSVDLQPLHYARYTYPQSLISSYDNLSFFIASPTLYKLLSDKKFNRLGSFTDVKVGLQTGDNEYYLRKRLGARGSYQILDESKLLTDREIDQISDDEKLNGVDPAKHEGRHFIPYDKGGESDAGEGWLPNYYVPTQYFIDWSKSAVHHLRTATRADIRHRKGQENKIKPADYTEVAAVIRNPQYYFREGLTFSDVGVYSPTFRLNSKSTFDVKGSSIFSSEISANVLIGLLSSILGRYILKTFINHTISTQVDDIKEFFITKIDKDVKNGIEQLVFSIILKQRDNPHYQYHLYEQKEINVLIYQIYGLSEEDIREVELWYCRRYSRLAEAQGMIDEVKQKYGDYLAQCDRLADSRITKNNLMIENLNIQDRIAAKVLVRSGALDNSNCSETKPEELN